MEQVKIGTDNGRELSWESHPLRDDWPRSLVALLALPAIAALVLAGGFGLFLACLSVIVVAASLARYFFPARYHLDEKGVRLVFLGVSKTRAWSAFRNIYPHAIGVHLAPGSKPGAMDSYRGLFLRYNGNDKEVLDHVKRHLPAR